MRREAWRTLSFTIKEPASLDKVPLHIFPGSIRIRRVSAVAVGTTPSAPITLKHGPVFDGAGEAEVASITADSTTPEHSYVDTASSEDSILWAVFGSLTGTVDYVAVTIAYEFY